MSLDPNNRIFIFVSSLVSSIFSFFIFYVASNLIIPILLPFFENLSGGAVGGIIYGIQWGIPFGATIGTIKVQKLFNKNIKIKYLYALCAFGLIWAGMYLMLMFLFDISGTFMFLAPVIAAIISSLVMKAERRNNEINPAL